MSEQYRYPQMTPFCRVDSPTYFIRGMASFFKLYFFLYFFCHNFSEN
ncbi:unnamed protein product [Staurois parvus]|uniref:Uncharacterized protein n=1 Tax=Staurois parvus TaxID=386267 RepID=A0ABN9BLH3_9NEOB|nr:unnamed protein product [Staurois parvus]